MQPKRGLKSDGELQKLTKAEAEVMYLLSNEFLTPKKVAIRRKCSVQAVYKIIKRLKKKGEINKAYDRVEKSQSTLQPFKPFKHFIRLHGQEFNINIIYKDQRYKDIINKSNILNIDGNTVRLYRNSIEVYSGQEFCSDDVQKVTAESMKYWCKFFVRLENELKLILVKPRHQNIRLVNAHYAEVNNELARDCNVKAEKIRIYTTDDSKLWFLIDRSFTHEAETIHPQTSKEDMGEIVKPFFNDLRDNKPPTLSQLMITIHKIIKINKETASGLNSVVTIMKKQLPEEEEEKEEPRIGMDYFG